MSASGVAEIAVKDKRGRTRKGERETPLTFIIITILVFIFLLTPPAMVVASAFNAGSYLTFPPQGLSLRWMEHFLTDPTMMPSYFYSLRLAAVTAAIGMVLGTLTSLAITRCDFPGRDFLQALFLSPLLLPVLVMALALLVYYSNLESFGITGLRQSFYGLLIGHVLITPPYIIRMVTAALHGFDMSLEEAARNLGAGPVRAFFSITLPQISQAMTAGALFAFVMSFGAFDISLFLAPPGVMPLPINMFIYLRWRFDPTPAAAATFAIALVVVIMILTSRLADLSKFAGEQ